MEPPSNNKKPPDRARENSLVIESSSSSTSTPTFTTTMSAAAVSTQPNANNQLVLYAGERPSASASFVSLSSNVSSSSNMASSSSSSVSAPIEKLSRPMAFDKVSVHVYVKMWQIFAINCWHSKLLPHCYHNCGKYIQLVIQKCKGGMRNEQASKQNESKINI